MISGLHGRIVCNNKVLLWIDPVLHLSLSHLDLTHIPSNFNRQVHRYRYLLILYIYL